MLRLLAAASLSVLSLGAQPFHPQIPRFWNDHEVEKFEVPLANPKYSPRHMRAEDYYKLRVLPIYKTYPVYAPGREPAGYREWLKQLEPEIIFDPAKLKTKEDWIAAGKLVFESDPTIIPLPEQGEFFPSPLPANPDGTRVFFLPGSRYIIRKKGVLEIGFNSCANCHTRVMPDGSLVAGAQGMFDFPSSPAQLEAAKNRTPEQFRRNLESRWILFGAPWAESKESFMSRITPELAMAMLRARRSGVLARQGTSPFSPPHVPSLIGIEHRRYLDATGFARHRNLGDLARYAITNQGLDTLAHFGDFQPSKDGTAFSMEMGSRYSDEQLYALALYIYSLKPPLNPNKPSELSRRGEKIFQRQACSGCHPAPLYTNNKLTPAPGFSVPPELRKTDSILDISVGTDPTLALTTRRGTGFYKVPSLLGLWYRNAYGHSGWVDTLEDWFNPARLQPDFQPQGNLPKGSIPGHEFGLRLNSEDKAALIAFLRTL